MLFELPIIIEFRNVLSDSGAHPIFFLCLYILIPISLITSFICLLTIYRKIKSLEHKTKRMRELSSIIQKGASVYLRQQSKMLLIVVAILFIPVGLTGIEFLENKVLGFIIVGLIFVLGAISSLIAGYIGMLAATKTNIIVIEASMEDPNEGFKLAYYGGMITGILNISMFVLGIWLILILTDPQNKH
jgi:K(+)-stimulated pyrophosphate-energized sodium pump